MPELKPKPAELSPPENQLRSTVDPAHPRFLKNFDATRHLVGEVRQQLETIYQGGGEKAIEAQHNKKRLTARERVSLLLDEDEAEGSNFQELGAFAAFGMYEEWGGAPAAGVVTGLGRIAGRLFMVIANDATVKAGAFFPMTAKKVIRAQNIAI